MKQPPNRRKRLFVLIALIVVIGAVVWFSKNGSNDKKETPTTTVTRGDIEETVTAQGKLEPKEYVDVGAQVSGQLQKVHIEIGDMVKKGQLLGEIDPRLYQAQVEVNEARVKALDAQIKQQQAQLILAKQVYARNAGLIKVNAVSKEVLQTSKANLDAAVASLASLKAQTEEAFSSLKGAKTNLLYTKIYAPIDGTVTSQTTKEGMTINANQTAPNIMQVANLDVMTVRAQVAEADVSRLSPGMDVYFTTLGGGDKRWAGKVRQILPAPVTINDVVLYEALVDVDNSDHALMTGMSTQMFFVLGQAKDVLIVPFTALRKPVPANDTETGKAYQVELQDGTKTVLVGMVTRTQAEILNGLSEGEIVVLPLPATTPAPRTGGGRAMGPRL